MYWLSSMLSLWGCDDIPGSCCCKEIAKAKNGYFGVLSQILGFSDDVIPIAGPISKVLHTADKEFSQLPPVQIPFKYNDTKTFAGNLIRKRIPK